MRHMLVVAGVFATVVASLVGVHAQKPPQDQWPSYAHNSNYSTLTQITPENVSRHPGTCRSRTR